MTNESVFFDEDDVMLRASIDRRWAEDWDSPEDEEYDRQTEPDYFWLDEYENWKEHMSDRDMADCD